jgi:ABC-2 type transport system permease protein
VTTYGALSRAHYLAFARDKRSFIFGFLFPLVLVVVFGLIFGRQEAPNGLKVINYIVPGVLSWGVGTSAVFGVAYTTMNWRANDVLRLVRMTPVSLPTVVASRFGVTIGVGVVQAVVFLAVGSLPWFGLRISLVGLLLSLPLLLLGVVTFFSLGLLIGNFANSPEGVTAVANCVMIPMAYLSGAFIPSYGWPLWLRAISQLLPLRYMSEGTTAVLAGTGYTVADVLVPIGALLGFAVVFGLLAMRTFRWVNES